ncbi:ABC transporter permease [Peribacillus sp. SCS-26]|uniref:ABC transporter permease n=1 Tax=Paraperibacillus marinus TaxID=3115295 RepID=UPI0039068D6C
MRPFIRWEFFLILLLLLELMVFGIISPGFMNLGNLLFSMNDFMYISMAAIPMTLVIITGGIDVSVGSIMGLSSILTGVLWKEGVPLTLAVLAALTAAIAAGLLNGLIITAANVQPLVVTLGGMFLYSGIALVISGGSKASGYEGITGFPDAFSGMANGSLLGIPNPLWFLGLLTLIFCWLLHYTRYGRRLFLTGINPKTAHYSGIRVKPVIISAYMLSGLGGGLGGVLLTSYFSSARADLGSEAVLPVITAVVLGGASILGGQGTIAGTVLASMVVGIMQYGLQMAGLASEQAGIAIGLLLIFTVLLRQSRIKGIFKALVKHDKTASNLKV